MDDVLNDIGTALMRLRAAFAKHNIPCPDVLEYSDTDKAYPAFQALRRSTAAHDPNWVMDQTAKPYAESSLVGFTLRFEARSIERPGTGVELDDGVTARVFMDRPPFGGQG